MRIFEKEIPKNSLIKGALRRIDYADVFALHIKKEKAIPLEDLVKEFFYTLPRWFKLLMGIRETIADWIGLKTAKEMDVQEQIENFKGKKGEVIALFKVFDRNEKEIVLGENDKHLDFRLSFLQEEASEGTEISCSTIVQFNGWLGRLYFLPVKPFHKLIVPIMLKRIAQNLSNK